MASIIGPVTEHNLRHQVMDSLMQGSRATAAALRPGEPRAQVLKRGGSLAHLPRLSVLKRAGSVGQVKPVPPGFGQR